MLLARNEKTFYGEVMVFFFKKLENKGKDLISICSNVDVNGCFDFFYLFFNRFCTQNVFVLLTKTDSIKNLKLYKKRMKVLINLNHKSVWYIYLLFLWPLLIFQETVWLLFESLVDWRQYLSIHFRSASSILSRFQTAF